MRFRQQQAHRVLKMFADRLMEGEYVDADAVSILIERKLQVA
jgi:hypothetical protein